MSVTYTSSQLKELIGCILYHGSDELIIYEVEEASISVTINGVKETLKRAIFLTYLEESLIYLTDKDDSPLVSLHFYFNYNKD